jgi:HK97 gp10 family phage protein
MECERLMATLEFKGLDEYVKQLNDIQAHTDEFCGVAIYKGADVVADAVKSAIRALPTDNRYVKSGDMKAGPSSMQKKGLIEGFGIAPMRKDGTLLNVKLGFDGYNDIKTDSWPNGQPNSMIARSIESGTSFMKANHFMSKAVNGSKGACEQTMKNTFDAYLTELMSRYSN